MDAERELQLVLELDAPRTHIWRCWTEPELLVQWFTPAPWRTVRAELDPRPGGRMNVTMCSPEGDEMPGSGVFLEVVEHERIVTTDAYTEGWQPSDKPFMTTLITLADAGPGKTTYQARVRHWSAQDRQAHEDMGFESGWSAAARQLEALARTL